MSNYERACRYDELLAMYGVDQYERAAAMAARGHDLEGQVLARFRGLVDSGTAVEVAFDAALNDTATHSDPAAHAGARHAAGRAQADDAIARYLTLRAAGTDEAAALAQVGPERSLAGQAAIGFASMTSGGFSENEARVQAVHDAVLADAIEHGYEIWRDSAPAVAETAASDSDSDDTDWRWNPPASALVPEREPAQGSWIARNLPPTPVLAVSDDYEPDVLTPEEEESEQFAYDSGEEGARPYTGMADAMEVNQSGVLRNWDVDTFPPVLSAEPWVAEYWAAVHADLARVAPAGTPERARAVWAEATQISNHVFSCNLPSRQCETCDADNHSDGVFWETEVPAARSLLHDEAPVSQSDAVGSDTADVLARIDDVLAEPEPAPLAEVVEQCGRAVDDAADAMYRVAVTGEDNERAQRLARWNADDTSESTEGWERA
ncbi:hypothetical protein [Amycolatopsis sp. NPDC050768]|uniref:hypothetical protein n=1 Tax=Amycolatopsis sp. NPDC050768 TaxID=3154839 RepID=UPI0033DBED7C